MATLLSLEEKPQEEDEVEMSFKRYKELFSTLPKEKGWMSEHLYKYQGFWYNLKYGLGTMAVQQYFKPKSTDILLISSPKSGTIWLKAIVFSIMNRTRYNTSTHPLQSSNPHVLVPFLELSLFVKHPFADVEELPSPRLLATHIPFDSLSDSIKDSNCRIVYICRNPKDVLVSMWKFMSKLREKHLPPFSLQEAYDLFTKGISEFGPYWDHLEGYKRASIDRPESVFFVTYEDMKKDTSAYLKKLAEFLGQPFTSEEEDHGVVEEILELCSFEKLKNLEVNIRGPTFGGATTNDVFFREGKVGDWKNHLTTQMIDYLDQTTKEKLGDLFPHN